MYRFLILVFSVLLSLNGQTAGLPPAFKAHYEVKKGPLTLGRATHELKYGPGGELVYVSSSDTTGLADLLVSDHIIETTRLRQDGEHLLPLEYHYNRSGKRSRTMSQQFDWAQGKVISQVDGTVLEHPLPDDTLDQSAYQVSLMIDLAKGDREFIYNVVGRKGLHTYDIEHIGDERIDTIYGKLNTVVIQRKEKQTTTMWCAYDLHFLPVKIQHEENGGVFTAYLKSVEGLNIP